MNGSEIIIPRHQLAGCFVEAVIGAPANVRGEYHKDSFRHHVRLSDFSTGKQKCDGVFSRYVKLETSNMRSLQESEYIEQFSACGTIEVDPDFTEKRLEGLRRLLDYALQECGCGSSRKMGYGRGVLDTLEIAE